MSLGAHRASGPSMVSIAAAMSLTSMRIPSGSVC